MTKILIIDDEVYFANNISKLLNANDRSLEVFAVYSAEEAVEQLEKAQFDIVVTDIKMPKMDGISLVEIIKKKYPQTVVIVMTAYGSKEVMESAFNIGSLLYIEKPFKVEKLENLITLARKKNLNPKV
ncbi:MAG: response regulator [Deltaproteobacteria bacterium]|nr:response regulator [Deltaproteobacteria bacterium]MCL5792171.1 response regulator [Deltaproteobacteria bacterium]